MAQFTQLGMCGPPGTFADRFTGVGVLMLVLLEEFAFEFLTLEASEPEWNVVRAWQVLTVPILQPRAHPLCPFTVLVVNRDTEVPQFATYRLLLRARTDHPVIVVVVIHQPDQEAPIECFGPLRNG